MTVPKYHIAAGMPGSAWPVGAECGARPGRRYLVNEVNYTRWESLVERGLACLSCAGAIDRAADQLRRDRAARSG